MNQISERPSPGKTEKRVSKTTFNVTRLENPLKQVQVAAEQSTTAKKGQLVALMDATSENQKERKMQSSTDSLQPLSPIKNAVNSQAVVNIVTQAQRETPATVTKTVELAKAITKPETKYEEIPLGQKAQRIMDLYKKRKEQQSREASGAS